jgi:hypothetical protein
MNQTIDCTPTWTESLPLLLRILKDGTTAEGRKIAEEELFRMAQVADAHVASAKQKKISG